MTPLASAQSPTLVMVSETAVLNPALLEPISTKPSYILTATALPLPVSNQTKRRTVS